MRLRILILRMHLWCVRGIHLFSLFSHPALLRLELFYPLFNELILVNSCWFYQSFIEVGEFGCLMLPKLLTLGMRRLGFRVVALQHQIIILGVRLGNDGLAPDMVKNLGILSHPASVLGWLMWLCRWQLALDYRSSLLLWGLRSLGIVRQRVFIFNHTKIVLASRTDQREHRLLIVFSTEVVTWRRARMHVILLTNLVHRENREPTWTKRR